MSLPQNVASTVPLPSYFIYPRNLKVRRYPGDGFKDVHLGPIHLSDPTQGLSYQLWTVELKNGGAWLSAPNTPETLITTTGTANWVGLSFDQNGRPFICYAGSDGVAKFYWFDTVANNFVTTTLAAGITRVFAALDDPRPLNITNSDIVMFYKKLDRLYYRAQRDRYTIEYDLGQVLIYPIAQIGMNHVLRFQVLFKGP